VPVPEAKIERVKISTLKFDSSNPNQMTSRQMEALDKSMNTYGCVQLVIVDQDNNIVDGAHRAEILKSEGQDELDIVRVVLPTDADRRILRQTMNKLRGLHDPALDAAEFIEILKQNKEKQLFETSNIRETDFYKTLQHFGEQDEKKDIIPELDPDNIITKTGTVWKLGPHRLMCGDSCKPEDVAKLMNGNKAHIVITDPPYGVDYVEMTEGREGKKKWRNIAGDDLKGKALETFCAKFLENIKNNSTEDSAYYIFFGMKTFHHLLSAFDSTKIYYALPLIWMKGRPTLSWAKYHPDYEVIAYGGTGAKGTRFAPKRKVANEMKEQGVKGGKSGGNYSHSYEPIAFAGGGAKPSQPRWFARYDQTTTWQMRTDSNNSYQHPTQKPVELAERALLNSSREGEVCLDLFAGAGFSLIAAHKLKRVWCGMELDGAYCDVIVKRFEAYSGIKAEMEGVPDGT
jgi:DNA modification methylase